MIRRVLAVTFILMCTSAAWCILSATIYARTRSQDASLRTMVGSSWGSTHVASPPSAEFFRNEIHKKKTIVDGKNVEEEIATVVTVPVPLEASQLNVGLDLEHRQKGLMWYSTYKVSLDGVYTFRNPSGQAQLVTFRLKLPAANAIYDGLQLTIDGRPLDMANQADMAVARAEIGPDTTARLGVAYRSQGLDTWRYQFGGGAAQARNFTLRMRTNFSDIDFAENALSPTEKHATPSGW